MTPRPNNRLPLLLALPIGALLLIGGIAGTVVPFAYGALVRANPQFIKPFAKASIPTAENALFILLIATALVGLVAAALALRPRPAGRVALTVAICSLYVQVGAWTYVVLSAISVLLVEGATIAGTIPDNDQASHLKFLWLGPALVAGIVAVAIHVWSTRRGPLAAYDMLPPEGSALAALDPRAVAHTMVHPRNPQAQSSFDYALALHFVLIAILPLMFVMRGCDDSYLIPGGGGGGGGGGGDGAVNKGTVAVKLIKKKQPTRRKKQFGRSNSAISLFFPSIDDSQVASDVAEVTENTYQANATDVDLATDAGGFAGEGNGTGFGHGPGSGGGFGGGAAGGTIRFIRLQYDDPQWNDGMDSESRADMNFLDELHKVSHLKTADHSEAIPVGALRNFKKGQAPPFVYFTGTGGVINLSSEDVRVLRQYVLDGGMIFADAGSEEWGRAFRSFIARVFPERELLDISNDDPIFSQPFKFPGAPALWHHDGSRARGMKFDGRWGVFYFPGNLNDAWKSGHGGQSPAIVTQSMRLGMNLVWYSFVHYLEATKQYRK